jgi:hypothetical protein
VSANLTEKGQIGGVGSKVANAFTLQLNTQFFKDPPACAHSAKPADCYGWQQFVYAYHYSGTTNEVFMQYWLLYYDAKCPAKWGTVKESPYTFCYTNSLATEFGALPASKLNKVKLVAQAVSGGEDSVMLSINSGTASIASNVDSQLDLSNYWNQTEWGVFGDAGGGEANFSADATLEAVTTLTATSSAAPKCVANDGTTGETNNLSFTHTSPIGSVSSPTMASKQTDGTTSSPSCAVRA